MKKEEEAEEVDEDYDPTPWCSYCGSKTKKGCACPPTVENN